MSMKRFTRKSANKVWSRLFFHEGQIVRIRDYLKRSRFEGVLAKIESINYKLPFPIYISPWEEETETWSKESIPVKEDEIEPINPLKRGNRNESS